MHSCRAVLILLLLATSGWAQDPQPMVANGVVAKVNDVLITSYQLTQEYRRFLRDRNIPNSPDAQRTLAPQVLREMIATQLLVQECERRNIPATPEEIDGYIEARMRRAREQDNLDVQNLDEYIRAVIAETGETEADVRGRYREDFRIQRLLWTHVYRQELIRAAELRAYYRDNEDQFRTPTRYKVRFLIVPNDTERDEKIRQIEKDLADGTDFEKIIDTYAPTHSRGDNVVEVLNDEELDAYLQPIPERVRALKVGEISRGIDHYSSFQYVRLEEKTPGEALAFDTAEAQTRMLEEIRHQRRVDQYQRFVEKLRTDARIEVYIGMP